MDKVGFVYVFSDGQKVVSTNGSLTIKCYPCGELSCRSGKIIACDAFYPLDNKPLDRNLAPGCYGCKVTVAVFDKRLPRVAYVSLCIRETIPTRWVSAHPAGFAGDNSIACLMDQASAATLSTRFKIEGEQKVWSQLLRELNRDALAPFSNFVIDHEKDLNMIAWLYDGDCGGRLLYGLDSDGTLLCITVDTELLGPA